MIQFRNFIMPGISLIALLIAIVFGGLLPVSLKALLYAVSLTIKEGLIFSLPVIIFCLLGNSVRRLGAGALKYIAIIIPLICFSNAINTILSYFSTQFCLKLGIIGGVIEKSSEAASGLTPLFEVSLPKLISNDIALLSGVVYGILSSFIKTSALQTVSYVLDTIIKYFFKVFVPIMPLFIIGTALKLQHDGILATICSKYLPVFFGFIISAYGLVLFQFLCLSGLKMAEFSKYLGNIVPAVITGFSSMSSAAALPLSIKAAEENSKDRKNAGIIGPSAVNIHLVGDCFFIPMMALAIMSSLGLALPSFSQYLIFVQHFCLAKFAVAAVPGGGVLVMLPIMQTYLGFSGDMLALITALYVLFDPIITSCNIAGNGAMALIFDRIVGKFKG